MRTLALAFSTALLLSAPQARAAVFKDAQLEQMLEAEKFDALAQAAQQRLSQAPKDAQALAAKAIAATGGYDGRALDEALGTAQQCVDLAPREAVCHLALARVMGQQVLITSKLKAIGLVPKVRASLSTALALDPDLYEARSKLAQIYLLIPEFLGGSVGKARELESAIRSKKPEQARLLNSLILARQEQWDEAERELMAVRVGEDAALAEDVRNAYGELGRHWIKSQQFDRVKRMYEQLLKDQPAQAAPYYYLGRLAQELERPAEAIPLLEKARGLAGAGGLPIDHRLGDAYAAEGQVEAAKQAYQRYLAAKRAEPGHVKDARKSLAALG
ncbi:lipopolysaccharide assembly protein LapB [Paucibacter sp. KBW04]|uniref:tetratricopeptide repeat protein n=1 Tax=Paucibacter sp. KBW04 TaxID=2153361 RepID=UPI000F560403|nr:hypothetical protein [Paucibacter sp. KBW04]